MMNKLIIIILLSIWVPQISKSRQHHKEKNLFKIINGVVQNTINKIFILLKLNSSKFTSENNNRDLLTTHAIIKNIAEKNYKLYKNMKKASKVSFKYNLKDHIYNLDTYVDTIVQEKLIPEHSNKYNDQTNKTGINLQLTSLEIPENQKETLLFLKEYFINMEDDSMLLSIDSPLQKIKDVFMKNKLKGKSNKDLQIWRASNMSENENNNITDTRRVFHGKNVTIMKYPFVASVHVLEKFVCGGAVISNDAVITAATCFYAISGSKDDFENNPHGVQIRVGSGYTFQNGQLYNISKVYLHPEYNFDNLDNNLAILKSSQNIYLENDDLNVQKIQYHTWDGWKSERQDVVMLGWGEKIPDVYSEWDPLSVSRLDFYDHNKCMDLYTRKYVTEMHFCAGFEDKGSGACQRDVGGPAVLGSFLVGVASFGPPVCGRPDGPTVFSSLKYQTDWIDSVIYKTHLHSSGSLSQRGPHRPTTGKTHKLYKAHKRPKGKDNLKKKSMPQTYVDEADPVPIQILQDIVNKIKHESSKKRYDIMNNTKYEKLAVRQGKGIIYDEDQYNKPAKLAEVENHTSEEFQNSDFEISVENVKKKIIYSKKVTTNMAPVTEDPLLVAIKNFETYVSVDKRVTPKENIFQKLEEMRAFKKSFVLREYTEYIDNINTDEIGQVRIPDIFQFDMYNKYPDVDVSNNYESELGLSAENELTKDFLLKKNLAKKDNILITNSDKTTKLIGDKLDKAQIFLAKNFVKSNNISTNMEDNTNNDELLVVHIKMTTQNTEVAYDKENANVVGYTTYGMPFISHFPFISSMNNPKREESLTREGLIKENITITSKPNFFDDDKNSRNPVSIPDSQYLSILAALNYTRLGDDLRIDMDPRTSTHIPKLDKYMFESATTTKTSAVLEVPHPAKSMMEFTYDIMKEQEDYKEEDTELGNGRRILEYINFT